LWLAEAGAVWIGTPAEALAARDMSQRPTALRRGYKTARVLFSGFPVPEAVRAALGQAAATGVQAAGPGAATLPTSSNKAALVRKVEMAVRVGS